PRAEAPRQRPAEPASVRGVRPARGRAAGPAANDRALREWNQMRERIREYAGRARPATVVAPPTATSTATAPTTDPTGLPVARADGGSTAATETAADKPDEGRNDDDQQDEG